MNYRGIRHPGPATTPAKPQVKPQITPKERPLCPESWTLEQVTNPDEVIVHDPSACRGCGADLADAPVTGTTVRQVFDIPPVTVHVTEHQTVTRRCACGQSTCGDTPAAVKAPVQYGPTMRAVIVYLYMGQFLSKKRTAQAISELFDIPLSHGTVGAVTARAATDLTECLAQITEHLKAAPVAIPSI